MTQITTRKWEGLAIRQMAAMRSKFEKKERERILFGHEMDAQLVLVRRSGTVESVHQRWRETPGASRLSFEWVWLRKPHIDFPSRKSKGGSCDSIGGSVVAAQGTRGRTTKTNCDKY